jgi:hypothetical protein
MCQLTLEISPRYLVSNAVMLFGSLRKAEDDMLNPATDHIRPPFHPTNHAHVALNYRTRNLGVHLTHTSKDHPRIDSSYWAPW